MKYKQLIKLYKKNASLFTLVGIFLFMLGFLVGVTTDALVSARLSKKQFQTNSENKTSNLLELQEKVLPKNGFKFKIRWGNLGKKMIEDGVIDQTKLAKALGGKEDKIPQEFQKYLDGSDQKEIELNDKNAHFWVDILWGLGLANKSDVLDKGPMRENGNAANYASTGGWTIGTKEPMQIYSNFSYIPLSDREQAQVQEISSNIYRPCCGNSTAFPDCNHGMAALGLIELMVSQNKSTAEIYKTVLAFNSYWFPATYLDIAYYFEKNGRNYTNVPAQEILSKTFSSAVGYQTLKKQIGDVAWPALKGGGSCGA